MDNEAFADEMDPIYKGVFENILKESKDKFDKLHSEGAAVDKRFFEIISRLNEKI
jgi:hypothetical protein